MTLRTPESMDQPIIDIDDAWGRKMKRDISGLGEGVPTGWEMVPLSNGFKHPPIEGAGIHMFVFVNRIFQNSKCQYHCL